MSAEVIAARMTLRKADTHLELLASCIRVGRPYAALMQRLGVDMSLHFTALDLLETEAVEWRSTRDCAMQVLMRAGLDG